MKIKFALGFALIVMCSACSTFRPATATEADRASAYIYHVERINKGKASRVIWVNPPRNKDLKKKG